MTKNPSFYVNEATLGDSFYAYLRAASHELHTSIFPLKQHFYLLPSKWLRRSRLRANFDFGDGFGDAEFACWWREVRKKGEI